MEATQTRIPISAKPESWPLVATFYGSAVGWLRMLWHAFIRRSTGKHKALAVRETAALGDRRFVSVIQFESQRFLIGSSPSSITLLAELPDEIAGAVESSSVPGGRN
jgi:flagellar biogenesis protein FliO